MARYDVVCLYIGAIPRTFGITDRQTEYQTALPTDWQTALPTDRLTDKLTDRLTDRLTDKLTAEG